MNPKKYRWVICFACTLALFCTGGLLVTGFNVYTPYLISDGGLTNAQVSVVLMLRNVFALLSMFMVVPVIRALDIRWNIVLSLLLGAGAFLLFSLSNRFAAYCAAMAFAGLAYGLGGMVSVSVIIMRWFEDHDGLALGICAAGTGLSAVVGAPILTALIEKRSMRASLRLEAEFVLLIAVLVFLLLKNYPSREKQEEVSRIRARKIAEKRQHEVFRLDRRQKGLLYLGVLLSGMSYNTAPFLAVLFREKGFDAQTVGWLISSMGLALCAGKCIYGGAADLLGRVRSGNLFHGCFVLAILLSAACVPGSQMMAYAAMILLGIGFPMLSVGLSELAAGTARSEYYSDAVKQLQILYMVGSVAFGIVPGVLADRTGGYVPVYYVLAAIALAAAVLQQGVLSRANRSR